MDEFYSDNFFDNDMPIGWSEKDWFTYLKKSEKEIANFASAYSINKLKGKSLDEIAQLAGWSIPKDITDFDTFGDSDFAQEPWTLINHPIYIITRGLLKCLQEHVGRLIEETNMQSILVWEISKSIIQTESFMSLAVNSSDLSEDLLARCNYKLSASKLNELMATTSKIPNPESEQGQERIRRINNIIFDLRELCLNLAEGSAIEK